MYQRCVSPRVAKSWLTERMPQPQLQKARATGRADLRELGPPSRLLSQFHLDRLSLTQEEYERRSQLQVPLASPVLASFLHLFCRPVKAIYW